MLSATAWLPLCLSTIPLTLSASLAGDARLLANASQNVSNVSTSPDSGCPKLAALANGTTLKDGEIKLAGAKLGKVKEATVSFKVKYELFTENSMLIGSRVNSYFWQTGATLYSCHEKKIAELHWKQSFEAAMGRPKTMGIIDRFGNHIGDFEAPAEKHPNAAIVKDLSGNIVAELNVVSKKVLGVLPSVESVSLELFEPFASWSPTLVDSRLLSLLAAGLWAPNPVGPMWRWIFIGVVVLICLDCIWLCCCRKGGHESTGYTDIEAAQKKALEQGMDATRESSQRMNGQTAQNSFIQASSAQPSSEYARKLQRQGPPEQQEGRHMAPIEWLWCCVRGGGARQQTVEMVSEEQSAR